MFPEVIKAFQVPFRHVRGFADLKDRSVYVRSLADVPHEVAHVLADDADHGRAFNELCACDDRRLSSVRRLLSIPAWIGGNIGNIAGIQNILTDYHLLAAYRKFSRKILGTEGHWEVLGEVDGSSGEQLIRLYPTPKGSFPVVVQYIPVINQFRSPQARHVANQMLTAEAKEMLGMARRKIAGLPTPDGGSITLDGEALVNEAKEEKDKLIELAIQLGEPLSISAWGWLAFFLCACGSSLVA